MKRNRLGIIACLSAIVLLTAACKDSFDIDQLHEPSKLSICCFPSAAGITWIEVTHTISIHEGNSPSSDMIARNAHIVYKVNGKEREVHRATDEQIHQTPSIGAARYYVEGPHQPGDHISIDVSEEGYQPVSTETTIPLPVPIEAESLKPVTVYSNYDSEFRTFDQLTASFTDPAETRDYYALRVCQMHINGHAVGRADPDYDTWGELYYRTTYYPNSYVNMLEMAEKHPEAEWTIELSDSAYVYKKVYNESEPLLNPLSEMDEDFGFDSNYYQYFYIFSDETINGQTYTLHLNLDDIHSVDGHKFWKQYRVELYHITPEMFRYLKSINDVDNNELAEGGFSILTPTFSNVRGGIGIVGGYALSASEWKPKNYY